MKKGHLGLVLAGVGLLLIAYAAFGKGWYRIDVEGADVRVGLKSLTVCVGPICKAGRYGAELPSPGGAFAVFSNGYFFGGILIMLLLGGGIALQALQQRNDVLRLGCRATLLLLPLGAGCLLTFPGGGGEAHTGLAMWATLIAAVASLSGSYLVSQSDTAEVGVDVPSTGAPPIIIPRAPVPLPQKPPAHLRWALTSAAVTDQGMVAVTQAGEQQQLGWGEVATVKVMVLPPDPLVGRLLLVDLGPLIGPPFRVTSQTRLELPDGGPVPAENLRRLVKLAVERSPGAQVDEAGRAFVRGQAPPMITLDQWKDYEAQLGP